MHRLLAVANLSGLDFAAIAWFVVCWVGYARYHTWKSKSVPTLQGIVHSFRRDWMARLVEREGRIVDTSILTNLSNSSTFFASTTLLILGGLLAMLGSKEKVVNVVSELPFAAKIPEDVWEIKILFLLVIFVYAFFIFTWSLRQFNFCSILVGAAPPPGTKGDEFQGFVLRAAHLASLASDSFNDGLRAFYFALAGLTWFVHPWLLAIASPLVVLVLHWREFRSEALKVLIEV
jgi:uncharacterized membrane protein